MKIRPVVVELFHADERIAQIYMTTLTVVFRKFANAPKNRLLVFIHTLPHFYSTIEKTSLTVVDFSEI
jgi:hypothetical protein